MYNAFRAFCERLLRIPSDPRPPPGDDTTTRIYRAAANYYKYLLFLWAIASGAHILAPLIATIVLTILALTTNDISILWVALTIPVLFISVLLAIFHLAVVRLDYEKRWYIVTDRSLRVREGVVGMREMTITFANIQNISISQGPVQRLLAIADLRVDTAGGGGGSSHEHHGGANLHTAWFRGIDNASEVRELIQQRLRQWRDAGLGDHDDVHPEGRAPSSPDFLAALREVYAEAEALRRVVAGPS
jgi:uncharacterized membrane protein YdbT with pleckstrin-like domain